MSNIRILNSVSELDFSKLISPETEEPVVPVVCIDVEKLATDGLLAYRMQGFANEEAMNITFDTKKATFYSRTRNGLWTKGEESGNYLFVRNIYTDCDYDSVLLDVDAQGPTCHNGTVSCFEIKGIGE